MKVLNPGARRSIRWGLVRPERGDLKGLTMALPLQAIDRAAGNLLSPWRVQDLLAKSASLRSRTQAAEASSLWEFPLARLPTVKWMHRTQPDAR